MTIRELARGVRLEEIGPALHARVRDLYPICRSITGDGVRETLRRIGERVPLQIHEVPTGTPVLDWTVPKEWNIRDAWVKNAAGERVIDFQESNLHVMGYSVPVSARMPLSDLRAHLHTLPEEPDLVPYRTSYYRESWGFCLSQRALDALPEGEYQVLIDSTLADGQLTYGECLLPGETDREVLLSCHVCHPSLANDNLSGIALCARLAEELRRCSRRYSYRFLFAPGTIGAITWLARNEAIVVRIAHGLVVACAGDPGPMHYKQSRRGNAEIDLAVTHVLKQAGRPHTILEFSPYGYDERQYCSPGFNLPVGSLTRTPHGRYPEYHTSADDLRLVRPEALADSFLRYLDVLCVLEGNRTWRNLQPKGEPQLGRRGLYRSTGGHTEAEPDEMAILWVLNLSDGSASLLEIAERAQMPFERIEAAAERLRACGLLEEAR
jgi:aminopeptidase-like protein